ncbi:MAG: glycosyltransferase family 1 protein [Lachnospiraceae bacterium]|jgi:hypothetical protein|nr:glycosyltransferase family 1 protein [Lachnospiraceae bacterium]
MRIVLFYSETESFNYFADQLFKELQGRGHEVFIWDLRREREKDPLYLHSSVNFRKFVSQRVDLVISFDGIGSRDDAQIGLWDASQALVVDILMDPPFRFHPVLEKHSRNYLLFCCDLEHVEYVKKYFSRTVPYVLFMPHVGTVPPKGASVIPYCDRAYDILFSGTYYRPSDWIMSLREKCQGNETMIRFFDLVYENLIGDSALTMDQAIGLSLSQANWQISQKERLLLLHLSQMTDWAVRMYQRERVVTVLAEAGFQLHLLGRGWENHPAAGLPNVRRISDRIPYGETLSYMANAKINLNVMPGFKAGTHDRIFNTLLQRSVPLTDSSLWLDENFVDGQEIALYDLKALDQLPAIANRLLTDVPYAENIIQNGHELVLRNLTWSHCADWVLEAADQLLPCRR